MKYTRIFLFIVIFILIVITALILTVFELNPPQEDVRDLGKYYLNYSYYPHPAINRSSMSPESVTAIIWDYRGLDTLFETAVFFLAVMGGLTIFRLEKTSVIKTHSYTEMTIVVKQASKILSALIVAVSASIALHGHLTPGGGFQGGTALAVAPLLILAAYSRYVLEENGLTYIKAVVIRSTALTLIWITVIAPVLNGYYLMQNQPFYPHSVFGQLISGSLFLFNLFEYLAVGMGFTAIFLYLSIPERIYYDELEKSKGEES